MLNDERDERRTIEICPPLSSFSYLKMKNKKIQRTIERKSKSSLSSSSTLKHHITFNIECC